MKDKMRNKSISITLLCFALAAVLQSAAAQGVPAECSGTCTDAVSCSECVSSCEAYLAGYTDVASLLNNLTKRQAITDPAVDPQAVRNLESCWCLECCKYGYPGDISHPCIYPCPCAIALGSTTTFPPGENPDEVPFNVSMGEIKKAVNYNICLILNLIWLTASSIAAIVMLFAGARYMTSKEPGSRRRSRSQIIGALAGLAFVFVCCPLVDYLVSGTDIKPFKESCECYKIMPLSGGSPSNTSTSTTTWTVPPKKTTTSRIISSSTTVTSTPMGYVTSSTTTSSTPLGDISLTIVYVPVDWTTGMSDFDVVADAQAAFLIDSIPLRACPEKVRIVKSTKSCELSLPSDLLSCQAKIYDIMSGIDACAKATGEEYDYVVGLAKNACGNAGFSAGAGVIFDSVSTEADTTHLLGHEWGLGDEYYDICRCFTVQYPDYDNNCLDASQGGSDPMSGYSSDYCAAGTQCAATGILTCKGNLNPSGGRCIMGYYYENAPGTSGFCSHCMEHLSTLDFMKC